MDLFQKLLWRRQNRWQLFGAGLGTAIGMVLLLGAIQLYLDAQHLLHRDSGADPHFVQINKRVNWLNTLAGAAGFSEEEIDRIAGEPFVRSAGVFTANNFRVSASSEALGFSTDFFFESVPGNFLDVQEPDFRWREGDDEVPIIISRDYLALYNFGFAPSQGLPQLTPGAIQRLRFGIHVSGRQQVASFRGRIVGFSDRFNSILVPPSFLKWANQTFGDTTRTKAPSRLVLEVDNPLSTEFLDFIEDNNYELSTSRLAGGQVQTMVGFMTLLLLFIGALIFVLSLLIILLNFRLIITGAREDIDLLLQLGYRPGDMASYLKRRMINWFSLVSLPAFILLLLLHWVLAQAARSQGLDIDALLHPLVWMMAIGLAAVFLYLNYWSIKRSIYRYSP